MEKIKKEVFVARDGREFDNEQDCKKWEALLLTPEPVHLQDEEIVGLLHYAFNAAFRQNPKDNHAEIKLYVKKSDGGFSGFDFWFTYMEGKRLRNFTGHIFGETAIMIGQSVYGPDGDERSADWDDFDWICLQDAYQYLDSIGYFTPREEEAPENPSVKKKDWQLIYSEDYSFTPAVVIQD